MFRGYSVYTKKFSTFWELAENQYICIRLYFDSWRHWKTKKQPAHNRRFGASGGVFSADNG
jgi:hypothetical protein